MGFMLSPGVFSQELDLSEIVPSVATSIGAIIIEAKKGKIDERVLITSNQQFIETFCLNEKVEEGNDSQYCALGYLEKGNKLYVDRVVNGALYGGVHIEGDAGTNQAFSAGVSTRTLGSISGETILFDIFGYGPGDYNDNISIKITETAAMIVDETFLITVYYSGTEVESWTVSRIQQQDDFGKSEYIEDMVNLRSSYIYVVDNTDVADTTRPKMQETALVLDGGDDGVAATSGIVNTGWDLFSNPDEVDINIMINAGYSSTAVQNKMIAVAEARKDCIAILDMPSDKTSVTDMVTYRETDLNANTNYAALYSPLLKIYDQYNDKEETTVPTSGAIAGVLAYTDSVSEAWFAPAGMNRGVLNVLGVSKVFTSGERDTLYEAGINPIQSFTGEGVVVWGQKTLQSKASALDRVAVRRLLIVLEKSITIALKYFVFEPNDELTRFRITDMVDNYLRDIKSRRGLYDYRIVCDASNNTAQRMDGNELWVDIYLKPVKAAEFIKLRTIITKTGASFEEIISRNA